MSVASQEESTFLVLAREFSSGVQMAESKGFVGLFSSGVKEQKSSSKGQM